MNLINDASMLELEVPGLAEKRPSVINNDMIDIRIHDNKEKCYRGIIKKVNDKTVEIAYLHQEYVSRKYIYLLLVLTVTLLGLSYLVP